MAVISRVKAEGRSNYEASFHLFEMHEDKTDSQQSAINDQISFEFFTNWS